MARRIRQEPWSADCVAEREHQTIPDLMNELKESARIRDARLQSKSARLALGAAGTDAEANRRN